MKKVIYTLADGGLAVVSPAQGARLVYSITLADGRKLYDANVGKDKPVRVDSLMRRWPIAGATAEWAETEDEFAERIAKKDVPAGVSYAIVDEAALPADRTFRDAWTQNAGAVECDMAKAREIHRGRIRDRRKPLLEALDAEWMKAADVGDSLKQAAIATKRQALRDAPADPSIDAAQTPEDLELAWPKSLST